MNRQDKLKSHSDKSQRIGSRDKVVQKMGKDGLVERNITSGDEKRISKRQADFDLRGNDVIHDESFAESPQPPDELPLAPKPAENLPLSGNHHDSDSSSQVGTRNKDGNTDGNAGKTNSSKKTRQAITNYNANVPLPNEFLADGFLTKHLMTPMIMIVPLLTSCPTDRTNIPTHLKDGGGQKRAMLQNLPNFQRLPVVVPCGL